MIVATYDIHEGGPRIRGSVSHPARWKVTIWARRDGETVQRMLRNVEACLLSELLPTAIEVINEMLDELPGYDGGGFQVVKLR